MHDWIIYIWHPVYIYISIIFGSKSNTKVLELQFWWFNAILVWIIATARRDRHVSFNTEIVIHMSFIYSWGYLKTGQLDPCLWTFYIFGQYEALTETTDSDPYKFAIQSLWNPNRTQSTLTRSIILLPGNAADEPAQMAAKEILEALGKADRDSGHPGHPAAEMDPWWGY